MNHKSYQAEQRQKLCGSNMVFKVSGKLVDDPTALEAMLRTIVDLQQLFGFRFTIIHGGGPQVDRVLGDSLLHPATGLRITPESMIEGINNASIEISRRIASACNAVSLSPAIMEKNTVQAERMDDHGATGRVVAVCTNAIEAALAGGKVPIVSFIGFDHEKNLLCNTNADHVAVKAGITLPHGGTPEQYGVEKLVLLSDQGLKDRHGHTANFMDEAGLKRIVDPEHPSHRFTITGGMRTKMRAVLEAIQGGIKAVHILHPSELVEEFTTLTGSPGATMIEPKLSYQIHGANNHDASAIASLLAEAQRFQTESGTSYIKPRTIEEITASIPQTLVMKYRGRLIGSISYTIHPRDSSTVIIGSFVVDANHQGSQYGKKLLQHVLSIVRDQNFETALSITAAPHVKRLFHRLGGHPDEESYADLLGSARNRYHQAERDDVQLFRFYLSSPTETRASYSKLADRSDARSPIDVPASNAD